VELSWSTFFFEIVNFLILIWILKRFLYKPVLEVIARRREGIEKTMADTKALRSEAEALQARYENRLTDWEQEKQAARDALHRDIEAERARRLDELKKALNQEREKNRVLEQSKLQNALRQNEAKALEQGARFATRLLERLAGPELDARLADLVLEELADMPEEPLASLRSAYRENPITARVASAYELTTARRERLRLALNALVGDDVSCEFEQDAELIAGLRITLGAWVLNANLQDELASFAESAHEPQ